MGAKANVPTAMPASTQAALDRIGKLLDAGSFVELSQLVDCGVVTGCGAVEGRLVYVYSQYGAVNAAHAQKIARLYEAAMQMGAPIVAILGAEGAALAEGMQVLDAYGRIFSCMAEASGVVPQIAVVAERCMGTAAFVPSLSDFVVMPEHGARLLLESPATTVEEAAKTTTANNIGGAKAAAAAGLADITARDLDEAMQAVKELLSYLPSNNLDEAPIGMFLDDTSRAAELLAQDGIAVQDIITSIADNHRLLECKKANEPSMITGFVRLNGYSVGIAANNGALTYGACEKAAGFVQFCDAFNIPLVSLSAASAYEVPIAMQKEALKCGAKLLSAFAQATVPRVNILCGASVGSPYLMMNSAHIGADVTFSWANASISVLDPAAAKKVIGAELPSSPESAAADGYIDQIIDPADTRKFVIAALEMLNSKRAARHAKKHGSITL